MPRHGAADGRGGDRELGMGGGRGGARSCGRKMVELSIGREAESETQDGLTTLKTGNWGKGRCAWNLGLRITRNETLVNILSIITFTFEADDGPHEAVWFSITYNSHQYYLSQLLRLSLISNNKSFRWGP